MFEAEEDSKNPEIVSQDEERNISITKIVKWRMLVNGRVNTAPLYLEIY